jgi:Protein of unknown function (DUF5672)
MLDLSKVTLVAITSVDFDDHIVSLQKSMQHAKFARVVLATHEKPENLPDDIIWEDTGRKLNYEQFSEYCIYHMTKHVHTDFCLHVHADSWIIRPDLWTDEFFNYDYIGAPWPLSYEAFVDPFGRHIRVGNGGFSLRSKMLLDVPSNIIIPFEVNEGDFYKHMNAGSYNEDGNICVHNRHLYELMGCKFAPVEVAAKFSFENPVPETVESFGFHKHLPSWANA